MRSASAWGLLLCLSIGWASAPADYASARRKIDAIQADRLPGGSRVTLTQNELNAYIRRELAGDLPDGVRNPAVELGSGTATGSALVDFARVRRSQGQSPGWLMEQLLDGERPVRVRARIQSAGGRATVSVESVEVSGVSVEGAVLDYLIRNYLIPNYPDAKVNTPFSLGHRIDRFEMAPGSVSVMLAR